MNLAVLDVRLIDNGKPLKAFVDVQLEQLIIRDFRVLKENGKRPRVASPQVSWRDRAGTIKYKTLVTFRDEIKGELDRLILNAYHSATELRDEDA